MRVANLALVLASVFGALAIGEVAGHFYILKNKQVDSVSQAYEKLLDKRNIIRDERNGHFFGDKSELPKVPHPYFGHVLNRALQHGINNEGFQDPHDFPYRKQDGEFVIGVFGGSVAYYLVADQQEKLQSNLPNLASRLAEAVPGLRGKKITVLNFALPAYKQPQQFFVASHFGDTIDLAVNLEGFNEIEGDLGELFPIYFPTYSNVFFGLDPLRHLTLAQIVSIRQRQVSFYEWIQSHSLLRDSAIVYSVFSIFLNRTEKRINRLHTDLAPRIDLEHPYYKEPLPLDEWIRRSVGIWEKYLRLEKTVMSSRGVPFLVFIQPNQYLGKKELSDAEKKIAIDPDAEVERYRRGYDKILERRKALIAEGYDVYDLTSIFKDRKDILYSDTCCHFNQAGNQGLEDAIADLLIKNRARWEKRASKSP